MERKQQKILKHLQEATKPLTSTTLATQLKISVRSVKHYVKTINQQYPQLIFSSNQGYTLNPDFNLQQLHHNEPKNNRIIQLILQLIKSSQKVPLALLSDSLYISESTLYSDLKKLRNIIQPFSLTLKIHHKQVVIEGLEKNKRQLLTTLLYKESSEHFFNYESLQSFFPEYNIQRIGKIIKQTFKKYRYFINDYSYMNLLFHLVVTLNRVQNHNSIHESLHTYTVHEVRYSLANDILTALEHLYPVIFTDYETHELSLLIQAWGTHYEANSLNKDSIKQAISTDVLNHVRELIQEINEYYYINLYEEQFFIRFALHINNLIKRLASGHSNKNPITNSIKKNCPLIYDCAVHLAHRLQERYEYTIPDDEIAYIAFHIGALETQQHDNKIKVAIVTWNYHNLSNDLINRITKDNKDNFIIQHVFNYEEKINETEVDLIISIAPLSFNSHKPQITITPFYTPQDQKRLHYKIAQLKEIKHKKIIKELLQQVITPDFFYTPSTIETHTTVLEKMLRPLISQGYVHPSYDQEIIERETMSSTVYGRIALPHSMKMNAYKTTISILINDKPITWFGHNVYIIVLLAIAKPDRHLFVKLFDILSVLLTDEILVSQINTRFTYEMFITFLVENIPTYQGL